MKYLIVLLALATASCATIWPDPIVQTGPDTYQITHTMGKYSPTKGVRKQTIERAQAKCGNQNMGYEKVREEMTPGGVLSYTLTFKCNSGIAPTLHTPVKFNTQK